MLRLAKEYNELAAQWLETETTAYEAKMTAAKGLHCWCFEKGSVDSETLGVGTSFTDAANKNDMPQITDLDFTAARANKLALNAHLMRVFEAR